jgi:uncharacterized protein
MNQIFNFSSVGRNEGNRSSKLHWRWSPGEDKLRAVYPKIDWSIQLAYGEEIGLGTRDYALVKI